MRAPQILIIEDDAGLIDLYVRALKPDGYVLTIAAQGALGLQLAAKTCPDLILLDIGMPDIDGLEICRTLRTMPECEQTPILFVSGRAAVSAKIEGLETGGDDYVAKPFDLNELRARIRARLRRTSPPARAARVASIELDQQTNTAIVEGRHVRLTGREHELLSYFLQHEGIALTNHQLIRAIWGCAPEHADPGIVRWQVGALRRRIEPNPKSPRYIHTVKQRGYLFRDANHADRAGGSER